MLSKLRKSKSQGFTIIEVMIVLAIAGLILLIVFLAVPALQRSGRNQQRKTDASALATGIASYIGNNNGGLPGEIGQITADPHSAALYCVAAATPTGVTNKTGAPAGVTTGCDITSKNFETIKLGYYDPTGTNIQWAHSAAFKSTVPSAPGTACTTAVITQTCMTINVQFDCTGNINPRTASVYYVSESGSGNGNLNCIEQ